MREEREGEGKRGGKKEGRKEGREGRKKESRKRVCSFFGQQTGTRQVSVMFRCPASGISVHKLNQGWQAQGRLGCEG